MKILVGRCFGLGNAVLSIPLLKAIGSMNPERLDVLIGSTSDDTGSYDVLKNLLKYNKDVNDRCIIDNIYFDKIEKDIIGNEMIYDIAIMAIPFDGRWINGVHFKAKIVLDCRPRPGNDLGLLSWKKHEIEYQMENVYELGYSGEIPNCSFLNFTDIKEKKDIYLGVGYKKDIAGQWKVKHWGNGNYSRFVKLLLRNYGNINIISTGDILDFSMSLNKIKQQVSNSPRFITKNCNFESSFDLLSKCNMYVGNDTGMMHVAASLGLKVVSLFFMENSITKSHPWCDNWIALDGYNKDISPEEVLEQVKKYYGYKI